MSSQPGTHASACPASALAYNHQSCTRRPRAPESGAERCGWRGALTVVKGVVEAERSARGIGVQGGTVPARLLGHPLPLVVHHSALPACGQGPCVFQSPSMADPSLPCQSCMAGVPTFAVEDRKVTNSAMPQRWPPGLTCLRMRCAPGMGGLTPYASKAACTQSILSLSNAADCTHRQRHMLAIFRGRGHTRVSASWVDESVAREGPCKQSLLSSW